MGIRVDGPLGPFRDGVLEMLRASGYSQDRAVQLVRLMAHLSRWLDDHGLGLGDLSSEAVEEFFGVFRLRHNWCRSSRSLALVLAYLRAAEAVPAAEVKRAAPAAEAGLLGDFRRYLRDQRGLGPGTVDAYARYAAGCIRTWWPDTPIAVAELDARRCHLRGPLGDGPAAPCHAPGHGHRSSLAAALLPGDGHDEPVAGGSGPGDRSPASDEAAAEYHGPGGGQIGRKL